MIARDGGEGTECGGVNRRAPLQSQHLGFLFKFSRAGSGNAQASD